MRARNIRTMAALLVVCFSVRVPLAQGQPAGGALESWPTPVGEQSKIAEGKRGERDALKAGEELYKRGEYALALERLQTAVATNPDDEEALMFLGLTELRLNDPAKTSKTWGHLQQVTRQDRVRQDVGRMQTILLREVSERAAKEAVANERALGGAGTDPRTLAVATFRNAGTPEYASLGKALAAMLIDNLSALPGLKVLEREQVQALEDEARLSGTGLVAKGTAVRAGKLLRAGRVTAGSHADWTASPTHLRLDSLLVDVEGGAVVAEGKSEALASEFFKLVPAVASTLAAGLNFQPTALSPQVNQRLAQDHTHKLSAALAFGNALDAYDRHDVESMLKSCKEAEKADPNFELAKKKCAFVPVVWLSNEGMAAAMEPTAYAMAGAATTSSWVAPAIAAGLAAGAVAGGTYFAVHGGGGGGGNKNNNSPVLTGVGDRTVTAGQTAAIDMECHDPDGTVTTIANPNPPPGATFSQTSGTPARASYRQTTNGEETGQTFTAHFTCTDSGNPPANTAQDATIRVSAVPTPTPATPPPPSCAGLHTQCNPQNPGACCSDNCALTQNDVVECCVPLHGACSTLNDCCSPPGNAIPDCQVNSCCLPVGQPCSSDADCCVGTCIGTPATCTTF